MNRDTLNELYWIEFLRVLNKNSQLYVKRKPSKERSMHFSVGISGIVWGQTIGESFVTTELYLNHQSKERNKSIFKRLRNQRDKIENDFGEIIDWAELPNKKHSRIKRRKLENVNCTKIDDWNRMIDFMVYGMLRMQKAFKEPLKKLN